MAAHRLIDLRNEAGRILAAIDKALAGLPKLLSAAQRTALDAAVADLKAKMAGDDGDALAAAMKAANDAAGPLTVAQMDEVLKKTAIGKKLDEF